MVPLNHLGGCRISGVGGKLLQESDAVPSGKEEEKIRL